MQKYNTIILRDDKNNAYIGQVEDSKIVGFNRLSSNSLKLMKEIQSIELYEFLIVEVILDDSVLQLTPISCGTLTDGDNNQNVPLFSLDHNKLLEIFNTMIPEKYK